MKPQDLLRQLIKEEVSVALDEAIDWHELVETHVYDAILDAVSEYENPMNYEPGSKKGKKKLNAPEIASKVVATLAPVEKISRKESDERIMRDMSMLVSDILDRAAKVGAVSSVEWDRGKTSIPYRVERSDYLDVIDRIAIHAGGLKPVGDEDTIGTYLDDLTGLMVTFGDGIATIK